MYYIPRYVEQQQRFSKLVLEGCEAFRFSQFSCEKQLCFAPFRTTSDGTTTLHLKHSFFLKYFLFKSLYAMTLAPTNASTIPYLPPT